MIGLPTGHPMYSEVIERSLFPKYEFPTMTPQTCPSGWITAYPPKPRGSEVVVGVDEVDVDDGEGVGAEEDVEVSGDGEDVEVDVSEVTVDESTRGVVV